MNKIKLLFNAIHGDDCRALINALDNGASPNACEGDVPALIKACYGETTKIGLELVNLLIARGAHIEQRHLGNGKTALHYCCISPKTKIVELLIPRMSNIDIKDNESRTPLFVACLNGPNSLSSNGGEQAERIGIIKRLLAAGADPKQISKDLYRALSSEIKDLLQLKNYYSDSDSFGETSPDDEKSFGSDKIKETERDRSPNDTRIFATFTSAGRFRRKSNTRNHGPH